MLDAGEAAELRTLQALAYGRGGGLNTVETARLSDLEKRRVAGSIEGRTPGPVVDPVPRTDDMLPVAGRDERDDTRRPAGVDDRRFGSHALAQHGSPRDETSDPAAAEPAAAEPAAAEPGDAEPAEPGETGRTATVARWFTASRWRLLVGAAAVLVVGIGLGWLLFGRDPGPAIPITAEQHARGAELAAEGEFDPGSMIPLAEDGEVLVWMSTQDDGATTCLVLDDGENSAKSCEQTENVDDIGLYGMLALASAEDAEEGEEILSASLFLAQDGEPVVQTQRGQNSGGVDFLEQFTDAEQRAMAARLLDEGFDDWSPMIAGYDGDVPIWVATREFGQEACLYYGDDADAPTMCGSMEDAQTNGISFGVLTFPEDELETPTNPLTLTLRYGVNGTPSILIERSDGSSAPTGASRVDPYDLNDYTYDEITGEPNE